MMTDLTAEWCRDGAQMGEDIAEALDAAGAPDTAKEERLNSAALRIAARVLDEQTVEEVAARIATLEEFSDDREMALRKMGWGERQIAMGRYAPHDGDCTKKPYTCQRCLYEEYAWKARAVLAYLKGDPT